MGMIQIYVKKASMNVQEVPKHAQMIQAMMLKSAMARMMIVMVQLMKVF